jgi:hypothetical protein
VEVAGPYMHDGSLATLEDVIDQGFVVVTPCYRDVRML